MRGNLLRELTDIQGKLGKLKKLRKKTRNEIPVELNKGIKTEDEEEEEIEPIIRVPKFTYKKEDVKTHKKKTEE